MDMDNLGGITSAIGLGETDRRTLRELLDAASSVRERNLMLEQYYESERPVPSIGIDTIINKKLVTASNIFRFTMSTDVQAIKCLTGSDAEVLEFIVKPNAPAVKSRIKDLGLPEDTIIGGIVRGDKVFIAVDNMEINPYDRVVVFAMPASVGKVGYFFN